MANGRKLPTELEGVARIEQLSSLETRIDKAYSSERYEEFQEAVEKIIWRALETDTAHTKLETKIQGEIKKYMEEKGLKNKTFWIPTIISILGLLIAATAVILKLQ